MLLPSVENTSTSTLNRQNKTVASSLPLATVLQKTDDATEKEPQQEHLEELPDTTFSTTPDADTSYLDTDTTADSKPSQPATKAAELKPDEVRFGRKRPVLPVSFGFGLPRPQAVAVAMRHPILDGKQPVTSAQAILDTLDLAATNRLPYIKGSAINLAA